jgi:signal transduction histidine kinase
MPEERRRVSLRARVEGGSWIVSVEDAGEGLAPAVRERLYQPFTSGRSGGVGLGLAVARRFIELHGGELELASGTLGGACFRVILPLGEPADTSPNHEPGEA